MAKKTTFTGKRKTGEELEKAIALITGETKEKKRGRKKKKIEPHSRLNADIPTALYDEFQELVGIHDGGNMTYVISKLVTSYIDEKRDLGEE